MPQKEIQVENWVIDPVTGYLTSLDTRHKFTGVLKKTFLEKLLELRDIEEACKGVGISRRILTAHLRADERFRGTYEAIKALIKNPERLRKIETVERLWKKTQG